MTRKIVQISTPAVSEGAYMYTMALADDGTLWQGHWEPEYVKRSDRAGYATTGYKYVWEEIPNIPQWNSNMTKVK